MPPRLLPPPPALRGELHDRRTEPLVAPLVVGAVIGARLAPGWLARLVALAAAEDAAALPVSQETPPTP